MIQFFVSRIEVCRYRIRHQILKVRRTSIESWPFSIVTIIVLTSTLMNFASIAPVLASLVHLMAISVTFSCKKVSSQLIIPCNYFANLPSLLCKLYTPSIQSTMVQSKSVKVSFSNTLHLIPSIEVKII